MVVRYEIDDEHRRRVDQALAMIDAKRVRRRKAKMAQAHANAARRFKERKRTRHGPRVGVRFAGLANDLRQCLTLPGWQVMAARMDPGVWYRFADIVAIMPEYSRGSVKAWLHQKLPREGITPDRAGNPDFNAALPGETLNQGGRYLYKLPASAVSVATEWRRALGECSDTVDNEKARL